MAKTDRNINSNFANYNEKDQISTGKEKGGACRANGMAPPFFDLSELAAFSISAHKKTVNPEIVQKLSVEIASDGCRVNGFKLLQKQKSSGGGKRGKIKDWSVGSRRRMRNFLFTHALPAGFELANITLTIPGPVLPRGTIKRIWNHFQVKFRRRGCVCVWRKEVQARGQIHYHLLAGLRGDLKEDAITSMWFDCLGAVEYEGFLRSDSKRLDVLHGEKSSDFVFQGVFYGYTFKGVDWSIGRFGSFGKMLKLPVLLECVELLKAYEGLGVRLFGRFVVVSGRVCLSVVNIEQATFDIDQTGFFVARYPDLSKWQGAKFYAVDVQFSDGKDGAWKRYIIDHATKSKQDQIVENCGRSWGVIGKKKFVVRPPDKAVNFEDAKSFFRFIRVFQRLRTPQVKNRKSIFGRSLGFPAGGGVFGSRVWFSRGDTVERLARWACEIENNKERKG